MSEIAYAAAVTMHEARWTDKDGSTVTFRLPMTGMENQRNPFEKWTKRRKGHAGTRFIAAIAVNHAAGQLVYADEVMLAGWNDSQTNGHTVKFWLCSDELGHPFEGFERNKDKFYISLVELDDDQEPVDQKMRDKVESSGKRPSERPSYAAAMLCKNEGFWQYCVDIGGGAFAGSASGWDEDTARDFLCGKLGIKSRSELDKDPELERRFHEDIRRPFLMWQGEY